MRFEFCYDKFLMYLCNLKIPELIVKVSMKQLKYLRYMLLVAMMMASVSLTAQTNGSGQKVQTESTKKSRKTKVLTHADSLKLIQKQQKAIAKQMKKEAKANAKAAKHPLTEKDKVYLFGVGQNFNDSSLYMTEVNEISFVRLEKRTKFLPSRVDYSLQFEEYLEGKLELKDETVSVFFSEKKKKASKWFYKMKKRYLDLGTTDMHIVDTEKFQFKKPE